MTRARYTRKLSRRTKRWPQAFLVLFLLLDPRAVKAAASSKLAVLSIEELMDVPIEVATKRPTPMRDVPGIVSLITAEQIYNSGARDLIDILMQVPGFSFGTDSLGTVSVGFRGNWGNEGKVLLLWDGHVFNEPMYGTLQLGRRYPVDHIKRIEIIRGPGSVVYGGFAELAVINIVTKTADDLKGAQASASYGMMDTALGGRSVSLSYGKRWGDLTLSLQTFFSQGQRSNKSYTEAFGNTLNLDGNSSLDSNLANLNLTYKGFELKFLTNLYQTTIQSGFGTSNFILVQTDFAYKSLYAAYKLKMTPRVLITPSVTIQDQSPWHTTHTNPGQTQSQVLYNRSGAFLKSGLEVSWDALDSLNWLTGIQVNEYRATSQVPPAFYNGQDYLFYSERILFSQLMMSHPIVNVTLGARYTLNSLYGSNFVPRFGLTKSVENWNFKLLYSHAFRAPVFENYNGNPKIQPENTRILEFETTHSLNAQHQLSLSLFAIQMTNSIVFSLSSIDGNYNASRTGTAGFELQHRYSAGKQYLNTSYSFASALNNQVTAYSAGAEDPTQMLAMSKHKIAVQGSAEIFWSGLRFTPSVVWFSNRRGYDWDGVSQSLALKDLGSITLLNLYLIQENLLIKNLSLGFGVMNLFNLGNTFVQPYTSSHTPLPGPGREVLTRLSYSIPL